MAQMRSASLALLLVLAAACGASGTTDGDDLVSAGDLPAPTAPQPAPSVSPDAPPALRLPADADAPVADWVAGVNTAGWQFHRYLEGNAVSSPLSIGSAFSMSRAGASPDTAGVLDEIFGFPPTGLHSAANAVDLMVQQASVAPTTVEVANRLFPDDDFTPEPAFVETAAGHYGASIEPIDTSDGGEAARIVNRWVAERTRDLIPEIVDSDTVQDQRLILVNTVYLKADWQLPFLAELTSDATFTTGTRQAVSVPFMRDREPEWRRYARLDHADAVELPYDGNELAMWLVVPHGLDGLGAVEASLDAAALIELDRSAGGGMVDLSMPTWEQTLPPTDLFGWLCPQGFCAGARFDGIAPNLFVTSALHGAKVIVDEKGTEAAAATSMAFNESAPPQADITIVADRPFLWAIVHRDTGALLFVGRVVNPAE